MAITNATYTPDNVTMLNVPDGTVPTEQGMAIIEAAMSNSTMMQLAVYEEMNSAEKEFDVFLNGIGAYWVGEGQRIETSKPTWTKVKMVAKKLGVILPVTREYLDYKQADFFEFMKPYIAEALYKKFDAATILGVDNPYTQSIDGSATDRMTEGEISVENFNLMVGELNDEGYEPNAILSKVQNNTLLRGLVDTTEGVATRLFDQKAMTLDGIDVLNVHRDITDMLKGTLYAGDFNYVRYGIPGSITYSISKDATLTTVLGDDGEAVNLFERDMSALRVTMDIAFMVIKDEAFSGLKAPVTP